VSCTASTRILSDVLETHSAIYVRTSALGYVLTARIDKCRRGTKFFLSGKCSWALRGGFQPPRPGNVITRSSKSDADVQNSTAKRVHRSDMSRLHGLFKMWRSNASRCRVCMKRGVRHGSKNERASLKSRNGAHQHCASPSMMLQSDATHVYLLCCQSLTRATIEETGENFEQWRTFIWRWSTH
jgi:hypothetical protein